MSKYVWTHCLCYYMKKSHEVSSESNILPGLISEKGFNCAISPNFQTMQSILKTFITKYCTFGHVFIQRASLLFSSSLSGMDCIQ